MSLFPDDRETPADALDSVLVKLSGLELRRLSVSVTAGCVMGSNSRWGVERVNVRKATLEDVICLHKEPADATRECPWIGVDPNRTRKTIKPGLAARLPCQARLSVIGT